MTTIFWQKVIEMLFGGLIALADYLSLHVLLCLVPAFFIAGAMVAFIPQDIIMKYIGKDSKFKRMKFRKSIEYSIYS